MLTELVSDLLQPNSKFDTKFAAFTACAVVLISVLYYFMRITHYRQKYSKTIPSLKFRWFNPLGLFGYLPYNEKIRNGYAFNTILMQVLEGFGKLFSDEKGYCIWVAYVPFILFTKAEAVEELISGTKMMQKGWTYQLLHPWLGTGLLTSHGSKWKTRRKLLTPAFHFDILKDFLPVFNEQSQEFVRILRQEIGKDWTNIVTPVTLCSLDIICETTLGANIGAQGNSELEYVKAVARTTDVLMERMVNFKQWFDFYFFNFNKAGRQLKKDIKLLHDFTDSVIQKKKQQILSGEIESSGRKRMALMDLLLEHHIKYKTLTEEDIREEVDTFAFEGHDTTSMGMSWALYLIGLHKDVQEKVHEELDRVFGDDTERFATTDDLKDLEYLDRVLKESQRLYPSVPMLSRENTEELNICGYTIPKGSSCAVLTYYLHRDEKVFPNAEKFDPDRFLPENSAKRHPYAYVPFSAGPRNCIGQRFALMEEKVVVSSVLRNFKLESLDPRDKIPPAPELVLRPSGPLRIRIRPRD